MRSPNPKGERRAHEDHVFDRLDVKVRQRMKLTSTNRPFGLTIKFTRRMKLTLLSSDIAWLVDLRNTNLFSCEA